MPNWENRKGFRVLFRLRLGFFWSLWFLVCGFALICGMASILVIGPHPDDQELGMGGTIAKLVRQGHRVHLVDMTNGEPTPAGSPEIRARESAAAAKVLGVERTLVGLVNRQVVHD